MAKACWRIFQGKLDENIVNAMQFWEIALRHFDHFTGK